MKQKLLNILKREKVSKTQKETSQYTEGKVHSDLHTIDLQINAKSGQKVGRLRCYYGKPSIDPCMVVKRSLLYVSLMPLSSVATYI